MTATDHTDSKPRTWYNKLLDRGGPVIPVVRLHGTISAETRPGRLNIAGVSPLLEKAFKFKNAPAVAIVVNSPGGSPVQSRLIAERIRQLAYEHQKRVLVFVEDAAASGGYFIATAGDEIIADPSSIVGSIGVILASFGFEDAIDKIGVKRRLYTAGKNKSTLDPFLPERAEDVERIKQLELDIHDVFISHVKARRGPKITRPDDEVFTGEFWAAKRALEIGLVDGLGDLYSTIRDRFGKDVKLKTIAPKKGLLNIPGLPFGSSIDGGAIAGDMLATVEERALWSRLGL